VLSPVPSPIRRLLFAAAFVGAAVPALAHDMSMHMSGMPDAAHHDAADRFPEEAPFLKDNAAAMDKMMADMEVAPTGDVDKDFVAMMVPHHQGAIDMAKAVLRYGKNEQLRRLAQEIIVTQQQEIAAMRLAIGEPLPPSVPSPTEIPTADAAPAAHPAHAHHDHAN
jgi:uncharacterized protein (DUF305 family)